MFSPDTDETAAEGTELPSLNVLICPDEPSWAFDNIARNIDLFSGRHRVSKLYMKDVIGNEKRLFETIFLKRIDLCHILWREDLFYLFHPQVIGRTAESMGMNYATLVRAFNSCAFSTSVYDHLFSKPEEIRERQSGFAMIDGYTVSSQKLFEIYAAETAIPQPDCIIQDGVDIRHFSPTEGGKPERDRLLIGWAGNTSWGANSQKFDVKGYNRLFQPVMAELESRGRAVEESVAIPQRRRIPFEEMPAFYRNLDVFVCTSAMEGTPNTVLEAMACGIPIVSTDVGIVPETFGELQGRFIVREPTVQNFADAIEDLLANPSLQAAIGTENRQNALSWSWENQAGKWWPYWSNVVRNATQRRNAIRRENFFLSREV